MVHPVVPDHGLYFLLHGQDIVLFLPRLKLKLTDQSANYTEWGVFHSLAVPISSILTVMEQQCAFVKLLHSLEGVSRSRLLGVRNYTGNRTEASQTRGGGNTVVTTCNNDCPSVREELHWTNWPREGHIQGIYVQAVAINKAHQY